MLPRILLLLAAGLAIYWLYRKRIDKKTVGNQSRWQHILKQELPELRKSIPPGYFMALTAISRSNMSKEECVSQLDDMLEKMKDENQDTQPIATLILKIEADTNVH